jgi:hypothetical protein
MATAPDAITFTAWLLRSASAPRNREDGAVTTYLLLDAAAPQPSWAGVITAFASLFTAFALVITAVAGYRTVRAANRKSRETAETLTAHGAQLGVIKTLVDGTLTAALQAQLDATRSQLTLMMELTREQTGPGEAVPPERMAAIGALRRRVDELAAAMAERAEQTRAADIQIATEAARTK